MHMTGVALILFPGSKGRSRGISPGCSKATGSARTRVLRQRNPAQTGEPVMKWRTNRESTPHRFTLSGRLATVVGNRAWYSCTTLSAVDQHIARLHERIHQAGPRSRALVQELWADIDLLLDRRMWLQLDLQGSTAA
jgi:hypothetical protein